MALPKITDTQLNENGVISAPDILTGTTQENKAIFDRLVRKIVAVAFNSLVDALEEAGVEHAALLPEKDAGMKYIRLGATGDIEVSLDGETWVAVAGSGASMETVPAHAAKHSAGGTDPLTPDSIGAYTKEETETKIAAAVKAGIGDAMEASY